MAERVVTGTDLERETGAEGTGSDTAGMSRDARAAEPADAAATPDSWPRPLRRLTPGRVAGVINLVFAYVVLLWHFRPTFMLRDTLATGGDMGSHHYISKAFDEFFPFALGGWATGWFAGMPMLEFYFPLPYLLIWIGEHVVGYEVAFKIVTVLGIFALPIVAYVTFRLLDAPQIVAALAPAGAIVFLFIEGREAVDLLGIETPDTNFLDIFGGFMTSTLAGEFAYSIGLALVLLALGLLYRATRRCGDRLALGLIAASGAVIGLAALTHLLPIMLLAIAAPALVVGTAWPRRLATVASAAALGAGLAAFFLIPAYLQREFTAPSIWTNESGLHWVVPIWFWPVIGVAAVGFGLAIGRRRPGPLVLAWTAFGGLVAFWLTPHVAFFDPIVNGRFLPIWYLMTSLLAAWGLGELASMIPWPGRDHIRMRLWLRAAVAVVLAVLLGGVLVMQSNKVRFWTQHNYGGYEAQPGYDELVGLMDTLDALPAPDHQGRVMWEYNEDYSRFGTPRALENVPFFTDKDTMEGLLIESAASAQPHFYLQGRSSTQATGAVPGYPYPGFAPDDAVRLMQAFGVQYYVAETPEIIDGVRAVDGITQVARSGRFVIFEVDGASIVRVPDFDPVVDASGEDWRDVAWEWMNTPQLRHVPVTVGAPGRTDVDETVLGEFETVDAVSPAIASTAVPNASAGSVRDVVVERDEIRFRTDRVGEPHLVAVSYYPNWAADGAEGPYLVTPSLMLVIPTEENVTLSYGSSDAERAGQFVSIVALLALATLVYLTWRRHRGNPTRARGDGAGIS